MASLSECVATTRLIRGWSYPERRAATPHSRNTRPTFLSRKRQGGARKAAVAAGIREAGHSSLLVREPLAQTAVPSACRLFWADHGQSGSYCGPEVTFEIIHLISPKPVYREQCRGFVPVCVVPETVSVNGESLHRGSRRSLRQQVCGWPRKISCLLVCQGIVGDS